MDVNIPMNYGQHTKPQIAFMRIAIVVSTSTAIDNSINRNSHFTWATFSTKCQVGWTILSNFDILCSLTILRFPRVEWRQTKLLFGDSWKFSANVIISVSSKSNFKATEQQYCAPSISHSL